MISIHAPRVGSDTGRGVDQNRMVYFYPRSPRGERPEKVLVFALGNVISIHAPRVGSDEIYMEHEHGGDKFLSTLPAWGATTSRPRWMP